MSMGRHVNNAVKSGVDDDGTAQQGVFEASVTECARGIFFIKERSPRVDRPGAYGGTVVGYNGFNRSRLVQECDGVAYGDGQYRRDDRGIADGYVPGW